MSTGSTRSPASSPGGNVGSVIGVQSYLLLNVKEANGFGITGDEAAPSLDGFAHQDREQLVGGRRIVEGDLAKHPHRRVHRGLPEFLGVHLAQTLVPLDAVVLVDLLACLLPRVEQSVAFAVGVGELRFAA